MDEISVHHSVMSNACNDSQMPTIEQFTELTDSMLKSIEKTPAYLPSKYWDSVCKKNIQMLRAYGINNFKRTVSQNYYNWLIISQHPQLEFLQKKYPIFNKVLHWFTRIESNIEVTTTEHESSFKLTQEQIDVYKDFTTLLWWHARKLDKYNLTESVQEPEFGNPVKITFRLAPFLKPKLITQDLANSIIECTKLLDLCQQVQSRQIKVFEIGAGSGRLAQVFLTQSVGQYFIFDIPPALALSQSYLSSVFPQKKIFKFRDFSSFAAIQKELENSDVAFFTSNQLQYFPDQFFNIGTTISTLPEMTTEQAQLFVNELSRLSKNFIFIKQWLQDWKNPHDGTFLRKDDYYFAPQIWNLEEDSVDSSNPQFFNRSWKRK